jgi:hypothetical protein
MHMVFNILCALFAGATSIIAWFAKNHYSDIDKRLDSLEGFEKSSTEKMHQIALNQARSEQLNSAFSELKHEVRESHASTSADIKELTETINEIKLMMSRQGIK